MKGKRKKKDGGNTKQNLLSVLAFQNLCLTLWTIFFISLDRKLHWKSKNAVLLVLLLPMCLCMWLLWSKTVLGTLKRNYLFKFITKYSSFGLNFRMTPPAESRMLGEWILAPYILKWDHSLVLPIPYISGFFPEKHW